MFALPDVYRIVAARNGLIGSTDARVIASGDWHDLWLEKIGQKNRPDLTFEWKPRLGLATEQLHAWWHQHSTGQSVEDSYGDAQIQHSSMSDVRFVTSIDRLVRGNEGYEVLEMKHTHARNTLREAATFYMGQLQWQIFVLNLDRIRFSIIRGNEEPEWGYVERDMSYIDMLVGQVVSFLWHVDEKVPPPENTKAKDLATAAAAVTINGLRPYDMSGNNEWADAAADFIRDKAAAASLPVTEKRMRSLIPADAEIAAGAGVSFKRDARGAYRVTIDEAQLDYWAKRFELLRSPEQSQ